MSFARVNIDERCLSTNQDIVCLHSILTENAARDSALYGEDRHICFKPSRLYHDLWYTTVSHQGPRKSSSQNAR